MSPARTVACLGVAIALLASTACEPEKPAARTAASRTSASASAARAGSSRPPTFVTASDRPLYDRAVAGMRGINALRGSAMTDALATDLGFKCADLQDLRKKLANEPDPVVWRLRTDIEKTCSYDVPIACALYELDVMKKKRAADAEATLDGECRALKLALADLGTGYLANPTAADVIGRETMYCEGTDSVRRVP